MIKDLFFFIQKKHLVFYLLIFALILALFFSIQSSETNEHRVNYNKTDHSAEIKQMMQKANAFWDLEKNDSALFYFNKTQLLCVPKANYADDYVGALNSMVEIFQQYGNYSEAETTLIKAFPYLEKTTNVKHAVNAYTFMAYNYLYMYDFEKALYYHRKALKKAISTFRKARILSEIAFAYMHQGKYQEAIDLLEPISRYRIEDKITHSNTNIQRAAILYNLGLCYLRLGGHKEASFKCFKESLELTLTLNDDYELIGNYYAFYLYYSKYNNPELKKINAEKAYYYSKKTKSATNEIKMLAYLLEADNARNSKRHWKVYSRKIDSLLISRKKAKNQFADIIYTSKKDKEENLELKNQKAENELELQRQKNRSFISYIVISISTFTLFFIAYYITHKGRKEKNDAVFESEIRISNKLHDELTTDIYDTLVFAKNHKLENLENKEKFLYSLNNIYSKTRNISRENSAIIINEGYENVLKEMISGYTTSNLNIIINGLNSLSWSKIDRVKKITIFRVVQEIFDQAKIISNASLASITFKKNENTIVMTYADNCTKIQDDINLNKRFANIENRLKPVRGAFNVALNPNQGFKVFVKLPI